MEKITNYKFKDFCKLKDLEKVESYVSLLELLNPISQITIPTTLLEKPKKIRIKNIRELTFGQVTSIRTDLANPTVESSIQMVKLVTGLTEKECYSIRIIEFYGIMAGITSQVIEISDMEYNELSNDGEEQELSETLAAEKMAKFGILNAINSLAGDDVTKWEIIDKMNYMTVFTKLKMDKDRLAIQKDMQKKHKI